MGRPLIVRRGWGRRFLAGDLIDGVSLSCCPARRAGRAGGFVAERRFVAGGLESGVVHSAIVTAPEFQKMKG